MNSYYKVKISIVIPVYNVKDYLDTCIDSVVRQTYSNLEIIIIDDGSTDGSGELCDEWAQKDKRIKVLHKSNGGLSSARNAGIDVVSGEFITFIDSDDYILPNYIEYLYDLITAHDSDISVCQYFKVDEHNEIIPSSFTDFLTYTVNGNKNCMREFLSNTLIDTTAWRKLYKTAMFKIPRIYYPLNKYHEDIYTTYRLIAQCNTITVGNQRLYSYRQRQGSIVNSSFSPKHLDAIEGSIKRFRFIETKYPTLKNLASKGIIYSANICMLRLAPSFKDSDKYIKKLKPIYRKYLIYYLKSNAHLKSKTFGIAAFLFPRMLLRALTLKAKQH